MLTRRSTLLGAALLPIAAATQARAQAQVQLRISTAAPPSDFLAKACDQMTADLSRAGLGINASAHNASSLFKQGTEVPALQRGTLEMSTMTTFEVAQQIAELGFLNRAYLFRDYDHLRHVFDGPIGADYRKIVADKMGIVILSTAYLGTRQVALRTKRHVAGPQDLNGVRMRMPAGPDWLLLGRSIGVEPVPMGMPEVYLALKTGGIDGQENPLSVFFAAKLYEVSEQVVMTVAYAATRVLLGRQAVLGQAHARAAAGRHHRFGRRREGERRRPPRRRAQHRRHAQDPRPRRRQPRPHAVPGTRRQGLRRRGLHEGVGCRHGAARRRHEVAAMVWRVVARITGAVARAVQKAAEAFCVAAFAGVFLVFVWKIAMRYAAGSAVAWADEVSVVLFIWIVFIANGFVVEDRRQISFDLLYRHAGPRAQRGLALARIALIGGLFAVSLPGALGYIAFLWRERTPVLQWRLDFVYSCFGLFMAGVLLRSAGRLARLLGPGWRDAL